MAKCDIYLYLSSWNLHPEHPLRMVNMSAKYLQFFSNGSRNTERHKKKLLKIECSMGFLRYEQVFDQR